MKFKRYISLFLISIFMVMLSSCLFKSTLYNKDNSVKDTMQFLTLDKCEGRLPGSNGIKEAEKFIMEDFSKIGLEKYNDSYLFEYQHKLWDTLDKDYKMFLNLKDGKVVEFKYQDDFLESSMRNIDLTCKISFNPQDENIEKCAVAIESGSEINKVINKAKAILVKSQKFRLTVPSYFNKETPIIQITPKVYNLLKENNAEELSVKFMTKAEEKVILQNNVIGVIKGERHDSAIVVSAHFDSVGMNAGKVWRGSVDNASGTAALIDIAKRLKEYSKDNLLKQDVIICAFNGEESNSQGSAALVKSLKSQYKNLYNINIDCIGFKSGKSLMITGQSEQSIELMNSLFKYISENNFNVKTSSEAIESDHQIFINNNIPAVVFSQEGFDEITHTLEGEEISNIDYSYIEKVSKLISEYIISKSDVIFSPPEKKFSTEYSEEMKAIDEERNSLNYNEYKYIKIGDKTQIVDANRKFFLSRGDQISEELINIYPGIYVPKNIGEFMAQAVYVMDVSTEYVSNPEVGKIYNKKSIPQNIGILSLYYRNNDKSSTNNNDIEVDLMAIRKNDVRNNGLNGLEIGIEELYLIGNELTTSTEEVTIGDEKYYVLCGKSDNRIKGLYRKEILGEETFYSIITSKNKEWKYITVEDAAKIYKDLKLKDIIDRNIKYLKR